MDKIWYLKHCDIFQSLNKEALEKISSIAREKNIPAKQIVYSPQDRDDLMFILKNGKVRIFRLSSEGKMITLAILKGGDVFGTMSMIKGNIAGAFAQTLEDSYICIIPQGDLRGAIKEIPDIALRLIENINHRLKEAENRIEDFVFRDVPGRIASILLKLSEQFGSVSPGGIEIDLKMTHQELADMVGAARETVTMVLNEFKLDGVIKINEKHITIIEEKTLKEWAGRD